MAAQLDTYAPLASPLPTPPEGEVFTDDQWETLLAIAGAFIPSLTKIQNRDSMLTQYNLPEDVYSEAEATLLSAIPKDADFSGEKADDSDPKYRIFEYLEEEACYLPGFKETLHRVFGHYVPEEGRKGIAFILTALK